MRGTLANHSLGLLRSVGVTVKLSDCSKPVPFCHSSTQANKYSQEQLQLMKGQDIGYLELKRQSEAKVSLHHNHDALSLKEGQTFLQNNKVRIPYRSYVAAGTPYKQSCLCA